MMRVLSIILMLSLYMITIISCNDRSSKNESVQCSFCEDFVHNNFKSKPIGNFRYIQPGLYSMLIQIKHKDFHPTTTFEYETSKFNSSFPAIYSTNFSIDKDEKIDTLKYCWQNDTIICINTNYVEHWTKNKNKTLIGQLISTTDSLYSSYRYSIKYFTNYNTKIEYISHICGIPNSGRDIIINDLKKWGKKRIDSVYIKYNDSLYYSTFSNITYIGRFIISNGRILKYNLDTILNVNNENLFRPYKGSINYEEFNDTISDIITDVFQDRKSIDIAKTAMFLK